MYTIIQQYIHTPLQKNLAGNIHFSHKVGDWYVMYHTNYYEQQQQNVPVK